MSDKCCLEIGARVRVKPKAADRFIQPWRGRFERGRMGTVIRGPSENICGWMVEWDHARTVKYPHEWRMVMSMSDLDVIEPPA